MHERTSRSLHRTDPPASRRARSRHVLVWDERPGQARAELRALTGAHPKPEDPQGPDVLVPVDFAPGSKAAVRHASRLARQDGALLHLVHVFDVPPALGSQGSSGMQALLEVEQDAKTRLAALARSVEADAEIEFQLGDPPAVIARRADELDADRIVMGAHRGAGAAPIGSVAREVRQRASCPVTLITAEARNP